MRRTYIWHWNDPVFSNATNRSTYFSEEPLYKSVGNVVIELRKIVGVTVDNEARHVLVLIFQFFKFICYIHINIQ